MMNLIDSQSEHAVLRYCLMRLPRDDGVTAYAGTASLDTACPQEWLHGETKFDFRR